MLLALLPPESLGPPPPLLRPPAPLGAPAGELEPAAALSPPPPLAFDAEFPEQPTTSPRTLQPLMARCAV